jgi:hypothetical protein
LAGIAMLICVGGFAGYEVWLRTRTSAPAPARHVSSAATVTLVVTVTAAECQVFIRVPGGDILVNRNLTRGQSVRFDDPRLSVVLSDAGAVRAYVNGELLPLGGSGRRAEFTALKG